MRFKSCGYQIMLNKLFSRFKPVEAQYELNFTLPKGSYATVLVEELAKRKINE